MKQQEHYSPPAVGGSSLLAIFAVLCLAVFTLLGLSSVQAERRQADAAVKSVYDYYDADLRAQEIYAMIRSGKEVDGVRKTGDLYEYEVPVSQQQILKVQLRKSGDQWEILQWQTVPIELNPDDLLDVWKGAETEEETQ